MASSLLIRAQIEGMLGAMSLDELRVIREVCTRVSGARDTYGPLNLASDKRDMRRERHYLQPSKDDVLRAVRGAK